MTDLKTVQRGIQSFVTQGDCADQYIVKPANMQKQQRMQIYRNAYYLRLIDILESNYPRLSVQLGKRDFGLLIHDYLDAYPSTYFSVHDVGQYLADFMYQSTQYKVGLIELAKLDWAMSCLHFKKVQSYLMLDKLKLIRPEQWPTVQFNLICAHQIMVCHYIDGDLCVHEEKLESPVTLLLWRKDNKVFYQKLSPLEICLFDNFRLDFDFQKVCEEINEQFCSKISIDELSARLQYWVGCGIFSDLIIL